MVGLNLSVVMAALFFSFFFQTRYHGTFRKSCSLSLSLGLVLVMLLIGVERERESEGDLSGW